MKRHADRTVVVTGASSGIGRGIARQFAREGARVAVADLRRAPKQGVHYETDVTQPTDAMIREELEQPAIFVETDVSEPESARDMVRTVVDEFGGIDVLVNNAGVLIPGDSQEITIEQWDRVMDININGAFYCTKFAVPHLVEAGGHIINIGSVHAMDGGAGPPYTSSKAAVVNLTRDLAVELAPEVNVNAICPGLISTPINDYLEEEDIEACLDRILFDRAGTPDEIGKSALFLASEDAAYITGQALYVDGGWTIYRM